MPIDKVQSSEQCRDIFVLFARGSGQKQFDSTSQKPTYAFFDALKSRVPKDVTVELSELIYPAQGSIPLIVDSEISALAPFAGYGDSLALGITNARTMLERQSRDCPDQLFILAGYSQGANVVGDLVYLLGDNISEKIAYVQLFGDPKFKADSWAARGNFERKKGGLLEPRGLDFPESYFGKLQSWCKKDDGICEDNYITAQGENSKHPTYPDYEIPVAVNYVVEALKSHFAGFEAKNIHPGSLGKKADIVFAVDTTATMQGVLNNVKANINDLTSKTMALSEDTQIGLVAYNDTQNGCARKQPEKLLDLTSIEGDFINQFNSLSGACGGSAGDDTYSGLDMAITGQPWRQGSKRIVVLLGGNTPNIPDKYNATNTQASVIQSAITNSSPINIVLRGDLEVQKNAHNDLSAQTGGRAIYMRAGATSEFMKMHEHILQLYSQLPSLPGANLYSKGIGKPGVPMRFNAGGSYDPDGVIVGYEWDMNGDGVFEQTTSSPVLDYVYTDEYQGYVIVKAVSNNGELATASSHVSVLNSNLLDTPPEPVTNVQAVRNPDSSVTLSWQSKLSSGFWRNWFLQSVNAQSNPPVESYTVKNGSGEVIGVVDGSTHQVTIKDVPSNQLAYFSVSANNTEGSSEATTSNVLLSQISTGDDAASSIVSTLLSPFTTTIDTIVEVMSKVDIGHVLGLSAAAEQAQQTESGEVQAAESKTLQSGFSPATQTAIFLAFIAIIALGIIALRTTSWYRRKKH